MNGVIYCATCTINGKKYVGVTSKEFGRRQARHKGDAESGRSNFHFHIAIRKYGWDSFQWEILESNLTSIPMLMGGEIYWIEELDTYYTGYNSTKGGEGFNGVVISEEARRRIGEAHRGKKHTEKSKQMMRDYHTGKILSQATKQKIREANIGNQRSDEFKQKLRKANLGKKHTEESIEKMREVKRGKKASEETKQKMGIPIQQLDRITHTFIADFMSAREAERVTSINNGGITRCCKGNQSHAGGFMWKYKEIEVA